MCLALLALASDAFAVCAGEAQHAKWTADRIEQEWPLWPFADGINLYLQQLAQRLAPRQALPGLSAYSSYDWPTAWQFRAVRDSALNAFSIGDGRAYVTDGAILAAENESELAAILAHEMGHQLAGHFCRGSETGFNRSVGSLHQVVDLSREMEADRLALPLLREAGFHPQAMFHVVRKMFDGDPIARGQRHERLRALAGMIGDPSTDAAAGNSPEFQAIKQLLRDRH